MSLQSPSQAAFFSSNSFFSSSVFEVETLLGHGLELLAIVLFELLGSVLVDGVSHEEHLEPALLELLDEGSGLNGLLGLTSDVVDVLLLLLHAGNVLLEGGHLLARLGGVEPEKLSELGAVWLSSWMPSLRFLPNC